MLIFTKKIVPGIFVMLAFAGMVQAQDAEEEIGKINRKFNEIHQFCGSTEMRLYPSYTSLTPAETEKMKMCRSGKNSWHHDGSMETILNARYDITVDHESEMIVAKKRVEEKNPADFENKLKINFDSLLMIADTTAKAPVLTVSEAGKKRKKIRAEVYRGEYKAWEVIYSSDYTVEKFVMYFRQAVPVIDDKPDTPRIEMDFRWNDPVAEASLFDEKKYISINGKEVKGAGKLAGYQVINLTGFDVAP